MAISNKISDLFNNFSFTGNIRNIRKALMEYFTEEGIKCEIKDGTLLFEYDEDLFVANFAEGEDCAECGLVYTMDSEEYAALDTSEKTFIAAKVNNELENHAPLYVRNESIKVFTTFYFTDKKMLIAHFLKHFNEMLETINAALKLIRESLEEMQELAEEKENKKPQQIGFYIQRDVSDEEQKRITAQKE